MIVQSISSTTLYLIYKMKLSYTHRTVGKSV